MHLARVCGTVVASIKADGLSAHKLLLLEPVSPADPQAAADGLHPAGSAPPYVAVDLAGAGVGEIVLVTVGSAARVDKGGGSAPTDAAVVAIVDSVQFDGRITFRKR